jgi:signal transduction histidine kinase
VSAETVNDVLSWARTAAFIALGVIALRFWIVRRDRPSLWAALCFGTLTGVVLAVLVVPEDPHSRVGEMEVRILLAVLLLFPYLLFRFAAAFEGARWPTEVIVGAATVGLGVWTFLLPEIPQEGEPRSAGFDLYLGALVLFWGALSLFVAVKLWTAGRGQPSVPRRRMRLLSFAATALTAAILLSAANAEDEPLLGIISSVLMIVSALAFLVGLAPPALLRLQWRRPEVEKVRQATMGLVAARTPDQVTADVLPAMAEVVGARAIFIVDEDGEVLGSHGAPPQALDSVLEDERGVFTIEMPDGRLVVQAGPYAPFFGWEEIELLRSVGAMTGLALDRSRLFVAEREAREALERADEVKSNFIALAAHELRTPVTSVHGVVSTLDRLGNRLTEQDRAELDDALRSQAERLRGLVDQLLDLSRLDAESIELNPVPIRVREHVEELVAASARERSREIELEIPDGLTATIDQTVFDRVVSNLLTNAIRHGETPVRVEASRQDRNFRIAVEDCGRGVPPDFVEDLFERFSRSDDARARGLGSGLGLSIARSYARAHGGDLIYADAEPQGARFELVVPQNGASEGDI